MFIFFHIFYICCNEHCSEKDILCKLSRTSISSPVVWNSPASLIHLNFISILKRALIFKTIMNQFYISLRQEETCFTNNKTKITWELVVVSLRQIPVVQFHNLMVRSAVPPPVARRLFCHGHQATAWNIKLSVIMRHRKDAILHHNTYITIHRKST